MLYLLISCISLILLSKSFSYKPFIQWEGEMIRLFSAWFGSKSSTFLAFFLQKSETFRTRITVLFKQISTSTKVENVDEKEEKNPLLDLPELALESILERLSPSDLCKIAMVCTSLKNRSESDHLWESHMKQKWDVLIGDAAYQEWHLHDKNASRNRSSVSDQCLKISMLESLWPFSWIRPKSKNKLRRRSSLPIESVKAQYLSLQTGKLWFPAQVYNRQNSNPGFMLSCYDAHLSYDFETDTFEARYSHHGRRTTEDNIKWERLRAAPIDTPPHVLHISDCLDELKPSDHIEIQWRKTNEFPYGWWYGVVGHLDDCDGNVSPCNCHCSYKVILEFNQYPAGSRWRRMSINRKEHREVGNETDGFYGGIRRLVKVEEISRWKALWPTPPHLGHLD